jgi:putative membrane protein
MKKAIAAAILVFAAGGAFAQTKMPAVATTTTQNPAAPVNGANSFTEGQAKSRIEAAGYSDVSGLMKDKDGIWRGKASKAGTMMTVSLDYQGNVTAN